MLYLLSRDSAFLICQNQGNPHGRRGHEMDIIKLEMCILEQKEHDQKHANKG